MGVTFDQESLSRLTLRQLRIKASELGIPLYSRKSKVDLVKGVFLYQEKKELEKQLISKNRQFKDLNTREIEHLATRSSIPYRDPTGEGNSKEIILAREIEQSKSQLINTSSWRKRWNTAQKQ